MRTPVVRKEHDRLDVLINNAGLGSGVAKTRQTSADDPADAILNLAVAPEMEGRTGLYFNVLKEARANAQAYDADARARLWALSLKLTGLRVADEDAC